jgi:hypothetical protein
MRDVPAPDQPPALTLSLWSIVPTLIVDGLFPFLTYELLRRVGTSEILALGTGAIFPAAKGVIDVWRQKHVDIIGTIVLVGIAVSVVSLLVSASPRLFLIRESFVTGAVGLLALVSFAWKRPLLFYVGRQFSTGNDPAAVMHFNALWERPEARRVFRLLTAVWSFGWLGEFGLRIIMVLTLSVAQVLALSPVVFNGITFGLLAWTVAYVRRQQRRHQAGSAEGTSVAHKPSGRAV